MEAADRAVDRRAAAATADEGRQESEPKKGSEQGEGAALLGVVKSLMAGGRKRRVEEKETSGTRGKSPRGDEEEAGLLDYDEERDGVGELDDVDMGQD